MPKSQLLKQGGESAAIVRVALIGPESTGKSFLSEALAKHFNTVWVPEFAREYFANTNREYFLEDILQIAKAQLKQEEQLINKANTFIFADTELIISKVWCEDKFKTSPKWIEENVSKKKYDFYLLTFPDIPWIEDKLRENANRRQYFFDWYEHELKLLNAEYSIIKGEGAVRLTNCIEAIANYINNKNKFI